MTPTQETNLQTAMKKFKEAHYNYFVRLGKRAVKSKHFFLMRGMECRLIWDGEEEDRPINHFTGEPIPNDSTVALADRRGQEDLPWDVDGKWIVIPDLRKASSLGCLREIVRAAHDEELIFTRPEWTIPPTFPTPWRCVNQKTNGWATTGLTEAEALIEALELAQ